VEPHYYVHSWNWNLKLARIARWPH